MFGVVHSPSGMYWMATEVSFFNCRPIASAWTMDPREARRFVTERDAFMTAYQECTSDLTDLEIVPLPAADVEAMPA